ncbi:Lon protease family protein [Sulfuriflexus mobilis]|uniref:Lon protease family protein n=1 Tax=Sulfuriflexus mobilis TaxID=1811807 RepID=UPI000F834A74|nr:ATP-binding protein [Sulfuriflexus mobilis]
MSSSYELEPDELYRRSDPAILSFKTTDEIEGLDEVIGQSRAIDAIQFGIQIKKSGYNLYVLGPSGLGKQSTVLQYLSKQTESSPTPSDWCYVNNFEQPHKPYALELPAGKGRVLCNDMHRLIEDSKASMPVAFESDEYRAKLQDIEERYENRRKEAIAKLTEEAERHDVALIKGPHGFILGPIIDGKVIHESEFSKLPKEQKEHITEVIEIFEEKLSALIRRMPQMAREESEEIKSLEQKTALATVDYLVSVLLDEYQDLPDVCRYFNSVKNDIAENVAAFTDHGEVQGLLGLVKDEETSFRRYEVNLLIDNSKTEGAPIIYEDNPVYQNVVGRVEHESKLGALFTDFTLIKPGALHKANGGYLVLDVVKLLRQPYTWDALKRALYANETCIRSLGSLYGIIDTVSLEPEAIPLDVKVVLLGERIFFYLLHEYDPDFKELFKVAADFEEDMERTDNNILLYVNMIATIARKEELLALDEAAVSRIIEQSARLADDSEKLTTHMLSIVDLMRESDHWARKAGSKVIGVNDVQKAIDEQINRSDRLRQRYHTEIQRDTVLIDTTGEKLATVNGLAVIDLSNYRFAHPVRITATTRLGDGEVIDIEREAELGGAIHSKGVLILSGFLSSRYVKDMPLSLSASLTFEQSYGLVEGDSASAAELCALLSSLAEAPIFQHLAITGSVNQLGQIQAIGGVNEKIEGFFDVCAARGLDGKHGVIIPKSNIKHLMLRKDVVDAVKQKHFHIYAVETIDETIEILTGVTAGVADTNGKYPEGSINFRVENKLRELSHTLEKFMKAKH